MPAAPTTEEQTLSARREERARYAALVAEGERLAAADPALYRRRLRGLIRLGYVYIVGVVLLAVAAALGTVAVMVLSHSAAAVKLLLVTGGFLFVVLRSLWIKEEALPGIVVSRKEAPVLFREADAIADRLAARRPDEIRMDVRFNAAAIQRPRFGPFGSRNALLLGLPLLHGLDPDEARSVIAHEFGHLSGGHGRFGHRVYRLHQRWEQLGANLSGSTVGAALFRPFLNWFFPRFAAMSVAIRRQDEYEADRAAVDAVGADAAARALTRLPALSESLDARFWNPLGRVIVEHGPPAPGFLGAMATATAEPVDAALAQKRLAAALAERTDLEDSHPALADRLRAMGAALPDAIPPPPATTAAQAFLGERLGPLAARLEADFAREMAPVWEGLRQAHRESLARLAEIDRLREERPLTEDETVERALLRAQTGDEADALPIFRELAAALPENAYAAFFLGQRLLELDDAEGVALVEEAARREPELRLPVDNELAAFHARRGDHEAMIARREAAQTEFDRRTIAEEGSALNLGDDLQPVELSSEERARLAASLAGVKGLDRAYAVRKRLPGTGELREYLFVVRRRTFFEHEEAADRLVKRILEGGTDLVRPFALLSHQAHKPWVKRLDAIPGALVFDARSRSAAPQ